MSGCVFCRIASGEIKADLVFADDDIVAFRDVAPQAPTHLLIIPRRHVSSAADVTDPVLWQLLFSRVTKIASSLQLDSYRLVVNTGDLAGQSVQHLHVHLLSGRAFAWPPG